MQGNYACGCALLGQCFLLYKIRSTLYSPLYDLYSKLVIWPVDHNTITKLTFLLAHVGVIVWDYVNKF